MLFLSRYYTFALFNVIYNWNVKILLLILCWPQSTVKFKFYHISKSKNFMWQNVLMPCVSWEHPWIGKQHEIVQHKVWHCSGRARSLVVWCPNQTTNLKPTQHTILEWPANGLLTTNRDLQWIHNWSFNWANEYVLFGIHVV